MSPTDPPKRPGPPAGRDLRIDVARGLAMITMTLSHTRGQDLTRWLPNRWSFADAADVFVTLSGLVAGIVFTRIALRQGWPAMALRVLRRCRTIWLAQIGSVVGIALLAVFIDRVLAGPLGLSHGYLSLWPVSPVLETPLPALAGLATLTWVPNNYDILPMYLVLLLFVPVMIGLHRLAGLAPVLLLIGASYGLAQAGLNLPANPWNPGQQWYFNPFAWILPFGMAFCFGAGWIALPRVTGARAALAAGFLLASMPLAFWAFRSGLWVPAWEAGLDAILTELRPFTSKTGHGVLRASAVFAILMLGAWLAGPGGIRLREGVVPGGPRLPRGAEIALGLGLAAGALGLALAGAGLPEAARRVMHLAGLGAWIAGLAALWCLAGPDRRARAGQVWLPAFFARCARIGRTSLACFVASAPIAMLTGLGLDATGGGMALSFVFAGIAFAALDRVAACFDKTAKRQAAGSLAGAVVGRPG